MMIMRVLGFAVPVLFIFLTAIAGYAYSQIRALSLPVPQALALFTVLLPLSAGLSTSTIHRLLARNGRDTSQPRPILPVIVLLVFQLIYETVIGTLSLTYLAPASSLECGLSERWSKLFQNKNEGAIRRIQDAFDCCGFRSTLDKAWPFPSKKIGVGYCAARYQRNRACEGPWRQTEQINAGLLLLVAVVVFAVKIASITAFFSRSSSASASARGNSWFHSFKQLTIGDDESPDDDNRATTRRLIDEGEAPQSYHDEVEVADGTNAETNDNSAHVNGTGNRGRVEPSGLLNGGELWREEAEDERV